MTAEKAFKPSPGMARTIVDNTGSEARTHHVILMNVDLKIRNRLLRQDKKQYAFNEPASTEELLQTLQQRKNRIDAVILGVDHKEPVRIAQRIHFIDNSIPFLILTETEHYQQLKQALKFSPFLGNDILPLPGNRHDELPQILSEMVERVKKRRNYQKTIVAAQQRLGAVTQERPQVEYYLDRLLDHAPIGVLNIDIQGNILGLNRRAGQILRLTERNTLGTSLFDIFSSPTREKLRNMIAQCVAPACQRQPEVFDVSDMVGSTRHIEIIASSLVDRSGQLGATVIIQDITDRVCAEQERSKAENALRVSERRYRELVQTMSEALALTDAQHRITYVNESFCNMFGYSSDEVMNKHLLDFVHASDKELMQKRLAASTESSGIQRYETAWMTKTNEKIYTLTSPKKLYEPDKGYIGCLGVFTNITERKKTEEHEKKQMMELAHVARVTTIGEMSSQIAHELAQPLTAIAGLSVGCERMLKNNRADPQEVIESLSQISEQAKRAREIVMRLRNFVRNEEIQRTYIEINELVRTVVNLVDVEARWHGVQVKILLKDPLPSVLGDRVLIEQVILNLLHNAIEAMHQTRQPERKLIIRTAMLDEDTLKVDVTDNGPGIDRDTLKQIYKPFFTTKSDGMGMGLAITRSVIDAHGGQLVTQNNKDKGCTFSFTLPTAEKDTNHEHAS